MQEWAQLEQSRILQQQDRYGLVNPLIAIKHQGYQFIGAGNQLYYSKKWKTYPDFLFENIKLQFGKEWWLEQAKRTGSNSHPVMQWARQTSIYQKQVSELDGSGLRHAIPSGPMMAYVTLAHDIITLAQHGAFQAQILEKLRRKESFHSARYELFVAAIMLRAGFKLEFSDETNNQKKHPEFFGVSKFSGEKIAVEAKRKNRHTKYTEQDFKEGDKIKLGVRDLLGDARQKQSYFDGIPYVIFLELDLPPISVDPFDTPWGKVLLNLPDDAGFRTEDDKDLFSMIILTNSTVEYNIGRPDQFNSMPIIPLSPKYPFKDPEATARIRRAILQARRIPKDFNEIR